MSQGKREELMKMTVEELRKICKENDVSYYENGKRLTKGLMIDKLMTAEVKEDEEPVKESVKKSDKKNNKKDKQAERTLKAYEQAVSDEEDEAEVYVRFLKKEHEEAERFERKKKYVEQAKVGTIVAFKLPSGKVISAAITRKSTNGRKFMVETKYGAEYKISFDDVLWVRTNKRWPKTIYLLFKQNIKAEVEKDGEEIS